MMVIFSREGYRGTRRLSCFLRQSYWLLAAASDCSEVPVVLADFQAVAVEPVVQLVAELMVQATMGAAAA